MLCLTVIANCVIMECGHSSICFECTMRLAIKARASGKPPYCHLCRKIIKYALKIKIPENKNLESPVKDKESEKLVKILSYVDMIEAKP